jgi:hypothetical protein
MQVSSIFAPAAFGGGKDGDNDRERERRGQEERRRRGGRWDFDNKRHCWYWHRW